MNGTFPISSKLNHSMTKLEQPPTLLLGAEASIQSNVKYINYWDFFFNLY